MPAPNPLLAGQWTAKKFRSTVINDIWPEVLFFTLIATMVALVSEKTSTSLAVSNQMLTVLGIVLGLVVSFRTSSAYDRYWEGRKLWTSIILASRNLAQLIWIHVPTERKSKEHETEAANTKDPIPQGTLSPNDSEDTEHVKQKHVRKLKAVLEKKTIVNLIQAFSVAVKHSLRGENGVFYEDLYPLICYLPRYATDASIKPDPEDSLPLWDNVTHSRAPVVPPFGVDSLKNESETPNGPQRRGTIFQPEQALPRVSTDVPLLPARIPPRTTFYDYLPIFLFFKPILTIFRGTRYTEDRRDGAGRKKAARPVESNVPLEISLFLSSYTAWLLKEDLVKPAIATALINTLTVLQDTVANLDRVRTTPIPFAYQAHLRTTMWIYLFLLPFQIYASFKYLTIPATAFASFLLMGFLEIGQEIENPFNYDLNDLDLDAFCLTVERELAEITAHSASDPSSFLFNSFNQPFAPTDRRNVEEILADSKHAYHLPDSGMMHVQRTLLGCWREIDEVTRHKAR